MFEVDTLSVTDMLESAISCCPEVMSEFVGLRCPEAKFGPKCSCCTEAGFELSASCPASEFERTASCPESGFELTLCSVPGW